MTLKIKNRPCSDKRAPIPARKADVRLVSVRVDARYVLRSPVEVIELQEVA